MKRLTQHVTFKSIFGIVLLLVLFSVIVGFIIWGIIHSTFIRPYVLTGVLRNYLESGMDQIPSEDSFALLDSKSEKFRKLHSEI